jgi:hypothetical protein
VDSPHKLSIVSFTPLRTDSQATHPVKHNTWHLKSRSGGRTDEWIKKMWYLHTIEFYSAMKKNEILPFSSKWMELENIILSEVSQAPLYSDFRSRANTAMLLDLGHTTREVWR